MFPIRLPSLFPGFSHLPQPVRFRKDLPLEISEVTGETVYRNGSQVQKNIPIVQKYLEKVTPDEFLRINVSCNEFTYRNYEVNDLLLAMSPEKCLAIWQTILTDPKYGSVFNTRGTYHYSPKLQKLSVSSKKETYYVDGYRPFKSSGKKIPYTPEKISLLIQDYLYWKDYQHTEKLPSFDWNSAVKLRYLATAFYKVSWKPALSGPIDLFNETSWLGFPQSVQLRRYPSHSFCYFDTAAFIATNDFYIRVRTGEGLYYVPCLLKSKKTGELTRPTKRRTETVYLDKNGTPVPAHGNSIYTISGLYRAYLEVLDYQAQDYLSKALAVAIEKYLPQHKPQDIRVVEFAAGDGMVLEAFRNQYPQYKDVSIAGIDISEAAKTLYEKQAPENCRYIHYWLGHLAKKKNLQNAFKAFNPHVLMIASVPVTEAVKDMLTAFNALEAGSLFIINLPLVTGDKLHPNTMEKTVDTMLETGALEQLEEWPQVFHRRDVNGDFIDYRVLIARKQHNTTFKVRLPKQGHIYE